MDTDNRGDIVKTDVDEYVNNSGLLLPPLSPLYINQGPGLGTYILVMVLGSFGALLVISYLVHWIQVTKLVLRNQRQRLEESLPRQTSKTAMVSIRGLERQTTTFMDMGDDAKDEYGIKCDHKWVF